MKRTILVVGPDGVGKTTIVSHLAQLTGMPSFKNPTEKQIFREGGRSSLAFDYTMTHFLHQTGFGFISDRAYVCEAVYAKVFKRDSDWDLLKRIDTAHANIGTQILYLYSSERPFKDDDIVPPERYFDVKLHYDEFMVNTSCEWWSIDTRQMLRDYRDGGDSSLEYAKKCLERLGRSK